MLADGLDPERTADSGAPADWREWLRVLFPATFTAGFADHHAELWEWVESIHANTAPQPSAFFSILARGGGKTTSAETATIRVGAQETRRFVLYVRSTQARANESVQSIADKLESRNIARFYPTLTERKVGKYGTSKGWRMDVLRCANDFNVVGYGLDAAMRGIKLDDYRPDLIVFDDIDARNDTPQTVAKKVDTITTGILPAGAPHCAYLGIQNLIHANSIFTQLVEGTADFLHAREISGPHPAVDGLTYETRAEGGYTITGGTATWAGQDLATCEKQINDWGLTPFLREAQHEVEETGGIWDHVEFRHITYAALPDLVHGEVWVDPAVTSTNQSDSMGIAAGGIDTAGIIYVTYSWERITSPVDALKRALLKALEYGFTYVGVETDQGGDAWKSVYMQAWGELVDDPNHPDITEETRRPYFKSAKAGAGHGSKVERNQRMLADYERGQVTHVIGTHGSLERALRRFPNKPLDLADAVYWLWYHLDKRRRQSRIW